ncbi:MAG: hypothetical protein ACO391_12905, partial [Pseudomonadales bacterium]
SDSICKQTETQWLSAITTDLLGRLGHLSLARNQLSREKLGADQRARTLFRQPLEPNPSLYVAEGWR